jgi:hypothetical protein
MTRLSIAGFSGLLLLLLGSRAYPQETAPPAHVAYVEGRVVLESDTSTEEAQPNLPIDIGDRLRTERGRAEVLFGDGSILHVDDNTTIDVLSGTLIREFGGRIAIITGAARAGRLQVDTPAGSVRITSAGEYRVAVFDEGSGPELEVAVIRGGVDLFNEHGTVSLGAGARAMARATEAPSEPMAFNSARWDDFDRWSEDRLAQRRGATSSHYVPEPVRPYAAVLDAYGSWNYEPTYGYVWFPSVVGNWRPYYHGHWRFYTHFGWTWVDGPVWGWPTHHYGRWGITTAGAWFWIPGATWGPAWVHWAVAPRYVSWCPLGFNGRPVVGFGFSYVSGGHAYDPWHAWTVLPRHQFGSVRAVSVNAVDGHSFGSDAVRPFVVQGTPPERPLAVARNAGGAGPSRNAPVRGAAGGAMGRVTPAPPPALAQAAPSTRSGTSGTAQAEASRAWGRDMRWTREAGPAATAVPRGTAPVPTPTAGSWSQRGQGSGGPAPPVRGASPGSPSGSRGPSSLPPRAVPRSSATPQWDPNSVPVYRGGVLAPRPGPSGAAPAGAIPARPYYGRTAPSPVPGAAGPPRAMPRGGAIYGPASGGVPPRPSVPPASPSYRMPMYQGGTVPTAPPSPHGGLQHAAPRQAPPAGAAGTAVPRSDGGGRAQGRASHR